MMIGFSVGSESVYVFHFGSIVYIQHLLCTFSLPLANIMQLSKLCFMWIIS